MLIVQAETLRNSVHLSRALKSERLQPRAPDG